MKLLNIVMIYLFSCFLPMVALGQNPHSTEALQIYKEYYQALGGLEKIEKEKTLYYKTHLVFSGLEGSYQEWLDFQNSRWAEDMNLKVFRQQSGFNGKIAWVSDTNGKITEQQDEVSKKRRKLRSLMGKREFLKPGSLYFTLIYMGEEKSGDSLCHKVKITNTINSDILIEYFDKKTGLRAKSEQIEPDSKQVTIYSDYRPVKGILRSFKQEVTLLPAGQKLVFTTQEFRVNTAIPDSVFDLPKKDASDFAFINSKSAENIPFSFIEKHIYLEVEVAGKKSLWVLDSGAGISIMDDHFARELGLEPTGNLKGQGAGNAVEISFVTMPAYQLPGIKFYSQKIGCLELRPMFRKVLGFEIDGILGYDFLSRLVTRIDYSAEKISFYHPAHFKYTGKGKIVKTPIRDNFFSLPLSVDGKYEGQWRLDLGAGDESFHYPIAEEQGFLDRSGILTLSRGAGGEISEKTVRFQSMEVAGFIIKEPLISFPSKPVVGSFSEKEFMGNVGNTLLRNFVLYLDYDKQQVILEKGKDFGKPLPQDKSGFSLLLDGNRNYMIYYIVPGSPAQKAGFKKGDIITGIRGIEPAQYDTLIKLRQLFQKAPGTRYQINIDRQGNPITIPITLHPLL